MSSAISCPELCSLSVDCSISFGNGCRIAPSFCLPIRPGEVTIFFGPSGCGKTTTLRLLAGLARPAVGRICFGETCWCDGTRHFLTPRERKIGMVFQNYALFPHLTVRQNLAFSLRRLKPAEREARISHIADLLEIMPLLERRVTAISGGQAQRVALGRSLAINPCLLLLDEPMAALDEPLRHQLGGELRGLLQRTKQPALMVTHDLREVERLGDYLLLMDDGRVIAQGRANEVLRSPRSVRAAQILGFDNILPMAGAIAAGLVAPGVSSAPFLGLAAEEISLRGPEPSATAGFRLARIERIGPCLHLLFDHPTRLTVRMTPQALREWTLENGRYYSLDIPSDALCFLQSEPPEPTDS